MELADISDEETPDCLFKSHRHSRAIGQGIGPESVGSVLHKHQALLAGQCTSEVATFIEEHETEGNAARMSYATLRGAQTGFIRAAYDRQDIRLRPKRTDILER